MKFQKILITGCKYRAQSLLYPCGALTACEKLEKTNVQSLRYSKTDRRWTTDQRTEVIAQDPFGYTGNKNCKQNIQESIGKDVDAKCTWPVVENCALIEQGVKKDSDFGTIISLLTTILNATLCY